MASSTARSISAGRRWRQIRFEHRDLGGFLLSEIGAATLHELFNGVASLFDEYRSPLTRFVVVQPVSLLDALVHERRGHAKGTPVYRRPCDAWHR